MSEAPEIIYLQWTGEVGHEDNTWCSDEISEDDIEYIKKDIADGRLELLRECNNIMPTCPKCKGNLRTWSKIDENKTIRVGHADDCEIAEELGNG